MSKVFRRFAKNELQIRLNDCGSKLQPLHRSEWPFGFQTSLPDAVYLSRNFLVQVFESGDYLRLSVTKCKVGNMLKGRTFADGVSWNELQDIKRQVGLGDRFAVEIYPEDDRIVNDANMRHLWIFPAGERLTCAW